MDPIEKRELKRKAWMRLAAQRRRAGLLRGRVVALSLVCFAVLWGIVFAQMATGNDPALSGKEKATKARVTASAARALKQAQAREREAAVEAEPEGEVLGPAAEFEEVEAEPEVEEFAAEEATPEGEEVEPEFVEEPLVTSQS